MYTLLTHHHQTKSLTREEVRQLSSPSDCDCPEHLMDAIDGLRALLAQQAVCITENPKDYVTHSWLYDEVKGVEENLLRVLGELLRREGIDLTADASNGKDEFLWKKRVLILRGPTKESLEKAFDKLRDLEDELEERDVVIQQEEAEEFEIALIGKDGTQKWHAHEDFEPLTIIRLIDSMPMRQQETYSKTNLGYSPF